MENLRRLRGIRRMDRDSKARLRELCGMKKGLDERHSPVVQPCGEDGEGYDCQESLCRIVCWQSLSG